MALRTPSTRTAWIAGGAVVAAGLAAVVGITLWARGPAPAAATGPGATGSGTATPGATTPGAPGPVSTPGASGSAPAPGTSPLPVPSEASELHEGTPQTIAPQPPPSPAAAPATTPPPGPSLTGPLPPTASAQGEKLVAGFPAQVVPVLAGIRPVSSSVSSQGKRLQVGLQASSDKSPATVTSQYTSTLRAAGFVPGASPAVPGTTATQFTRGPDGLVLTVHDRVGGGTELTISGTLTTTG